MLYTSCPQHWIFPAGLVIAHAVSSPLTDIAVNVPDVGALLTCIVTSFPQHVSVPMEVIAHAAY